VSAPDPRSGLQSDGTWVPAFPGQRPPLPAGHEVTVQHGAYSPRAVHPLAVEIRDSVLADPEVAYLQAPRWAPAVWAWAQAEAQHQLVSEYLAKCGLESGDGIGDLDKERVRSAYLIQHRARAHADRLRGQLGLTPSSWAKLTKDGQVARAAAAGTAAIMADLRRLEQAGGQLPQGELPGGES
jgi:hypothetical protein